MSACHGQTFFQNQGSTSSFHTRLVKINPNGSPNPAYADITGGGTSNQSVCCSCN